MTLALFTWFWALPFSILPMTGLWGRYVAGKRIPLVVFIIRKVIRFNRAPNLIK